VDLGISCSLYHHLLVPLSLNQFVLLHDNDHPRAYCIQRYHIIHLLHLLMFVLHIQEIMHGVIV
jgi:hypothetical protein